MARSVNLAITIEKFVRQQVADNNTIIRKLGIDAFKRVILRSPVDTGRFRANWSAGINHMPTGTTTATDKGGNATVARMEAVVLKAVAGDRITLANNLPYAVRLEYGHSGQAPNGMVRVTLAEMRLMLRNATKSRSR